MTNSIIERLVAALLWFVFILSMFTLAMLIDIELASNVAHASEVLSIVDDSTYVSVVQTVTQASEAVVMGGESRPLDPSPVLVYISGFTMGIAFLLFIVKFVTWHRKKDD